MDKRELNFAYDRSDKDDPQDAICATEQDPPNRV
jgi:hypothetical protein